MYFIVSGFVSVLHKATQTYIKDLNKDQYFGEIGFFSEKNRQCTVKSRDFTEVLELSYNDFWQVSNSFEDAEKTLLQMKINVDSGNYKCLKL